MNHQQLTRAFHHGEISARDLISNLQSLFDSREPTVLSFLPEENRFERLTKEAEELVSRFPDPTNRPPLFGMLVGAKDIFHVDGFITQAGSQLPSNELQGSEAESITKLKNAGVLILGKTVTTEFAYFFPGPTRNPHHPEHTPGGSSSGSAAAVGAGLCLLTLGTQTIGSIIRPAAFCGVVGVKPTYDRVSRNGVIPLSPTFDHIGIFANDVVTAKQVASVLISDWQLETTTRKPILGIPEGLYLSCASDYALTCFNTICDSLTQAGYELRHVKVMDDFQEIRNRHDAIMSHDVSQVHKEWFNKYAILYSSKFSDLIKRGQKVSTQSIQSLLDARDNFRTSITQTMNENQIDVWICPPTIGPAPKGLDSTGDPVMCLPWTQIGFPATNIPTTKNEDGLPMGLQLVGKWNSDESLLAWAEEIEKGREKNMTVVKWNIRAGAYYDSVVLMQLQRGLLELSGVIDAGVVMATQANRDLLAANELLPESITANPDDLLIVVKADAEDAATDAIGKVDELLTRRKSRGASQDFRPRSLSAAVKQLPEASWVLISVPGHYAAGVARAALELNKHVFLYSDNVSLEDEIALKKTAREKGLLVMGPDCGTAIINGTGLGFANRVRRGSIGVVGASGTGTQAVAAQIHNLGSGISHAIGTGGRDLKSDVGAITAHQALDLLSRDLETKVIALISKPPSPDVATQLISAAQQTGKPVVIYFIGYPPPARKIGNLHFAISLSEAAEIAVKIGDQRLETVTKSPREASSLYVRALFSGGTLAYETLLGLQASLSPIYSNAPITASQNLKDPLKSEAHTIIDLGDEFFMVGRLHPMIDNDLRIRRMKQEAADSEVGMILFDVVLGEGSHLDPAGELVPVIKEIREKRLELEFVAIVIGTDDDPQNLQSQVSQLMDAGVIVFRTATEAVEYISLRFNNAKKNEFTPVNLEQLKEPLAAINVGLESFYESLISQGAQAVHVEWRPPASGNEKLASLLARMKK